MAEALEAHCAQVESLRRAGFARRLRRTGWRANFISYDSTKWACCQDKYILGELLVRTDWEVVGGARVTEDKYERNAIVFVASGYSGGGRKGGRVDGVGRLKTRTLKPAWMRHPIIAPVGLEFSLHCFLQFVMRWGPPFLVERSIGSFWGTNKAAVEAPGRLQGPTSDGRLAICLHSSWYLFQERL